jgi:hypothetical protein
MAFEIELQNLKDKRHYWEDVNRLNAFYGCECPNGRWTTVWEDTPEGTYVLTNNYSFSEATLYHVDGKTYRLYNNAGPHDWDVFRELYVAGYESGSFRTEAPFYQQNTTIGLEPWSFIVTAPPNGEYGINVWDEGISQEISEEFLTAFSEQGRITATILKSITEKYNVGMTPNIFCPSHLMKNSSGYYWTFLKEYNYSYRTATRLAKSIARHSHSIKYTLIKKIIDINKISVNDTANIDTDIDHKATITNYIDQFYNSLPEPKK